MAWLLALLGCGLVGVLGPAALELWPSLRASAGFGSLGIGIGVGAGAGVVLAWRVPFLLVLDHELTHLAAAVLMLRRPVGLQAGEEAGLATYGAGRGSAFILLAPYALPLFAWVALPLLWVVQADYQAGVVGLVGACLGFAAVRIGIDARPRQPDLRTLGLVPSVFGILSWGPLLFWTPALLATLGVDGFRAWVDRGVRGVVQVLGG